MMTSETAAVLAANRFQQTQSKTPLFDALVNYKNSHVTSFDVPGHKRQLTHPMAEQFGEQIFAMDANSMPQLDLLSHPESVIKEAQQLMAQCFNADHAYFLVNGTTVGILAMIYATCKPGDKIIVPRNCHKSVMNGILMSGAIPIFVQPEVDHRYGIAHNISKERIEQTIALHPEAKVLLITYPTYFGAMSDLKAICTIAHQHDLTVIVDSAHGAHLKFSGFIDPIEAGADAVTMSMHKTGGSLTQSSILLTKGNRILPSHMQKVLNMYQTTSASYLLMSSLDVARRELALFGEERYASIREMIQQAIHTIHKNSKFEILQSYDLENRYNQTFDWTKLVVRVNELGLTGFEVYDLLKKHYNIQAELAEGYVVMFVISYADDEHSIARLVQALLDLEKRFSKHEPLVFPMVMNDEINQLAMTPQHAMYRDHCYVNIHEAVGEICAETVMIYPPGIPLIIPGEVISQKVVDLYDFYNRNIGNVLVENNENNKLTVIKGDK